MPPEPIQFADYKERILKKLEVELTKENYPRELLGFTLIEGFVLAPIEPAINAGIAIGGPSVPMVVVAGNSTGTIYQFAFKVFFPEAKI